MKPSRPPTVIPELGLPCPLSPMSAVNAEWPQPPCKTFLPLPSPSTYTSQLNLSPLRREGGCGGRYAWAGSGDIVSVGLAAKYQCWAGSSLWAGLKNYQQGQNPHPEPGWCPQPLPAGAEGRVFPAWSIPTPPGGLPQISGLLSPAMAMLCWLPCSRGARAAELAAAVPPPWDALREEGSILQPRNGGGRW